MGQSLEVDYSYWDRLQRVTRPKARLVSTLTSSGGSRDGKRGCLFPQSTPVPYFELWSFVRWNLINHSFFSPSQSLGNLWEDTLLFSLACFEFEKRSGIQQYWHVYMIDVFSSALVLTPPFCRLQHRPTSTTPLSISVAVLSSPDEYVSRIVHRPSLSLSSRMRSHTHVRVHTTLWVRCWAGTLWLTASDCRVWWYPHNGSGVIYTQAPLDWFRSMMKYCDCMTKTEAKKRS